MFTTLRLVLKWPRASDVREQTWKPKFRHSAEPGGSLRRSPRRRIEHRDRGKISTRSAACYREDQPAWPSSICLVWGPWGAVIMLEASTWQ